MPARSVDALWSDVPALLRLLACSPEGDPVHDACVVALISQSGTAEFSRALTELDQLRPQARSDHDGAEWGWPFGDTPAHVGAAMAELAWRQVWIDAKLVDTVLHDANVEPRLLYLCGALRVAHGQPLPATTPVRVRMAPAWVLRSTWDKAPSTSWVEWIESEGTALCNIVFGYLQALVTCWALLACVSLPLTGSSLGMRPFMAFLLAIMGAVAALQFIIADRQVTDGTEFGLMDSALLGLGSPLLVILEFESLVVDLLEPWVRIRHVEYAFLFLVTALAGLFGVALWENAWVGVICLPISLLANVTGFADWGCRHCVTPPVIANLNTVELFRLLVRGL